MTLILTFVYLTHSLNTVKGMYWDPPGRGSQGRVLILRKRVLLVPCFAVIEIQIFSKMGDNKICLTLCDRILLVVCLYLYHFLKEIVNVLEIHLGVL